MGMMYKFKNIFFRCNKPSESGIAGCAGVEEASISFRSKQGTVSKEEDV